MVLGGWSNRAMLSRYGAYAASERAFAAVASRAEALEAWGRPLQASSGELAERRAGGGKRLSARKAQGAQAATDLGSTASAILPSRRRTGSVGA
jgi:hypothetical protein